MSRFNLEVFIKEENSKFYAEAGVGFSVYHSIGETKIDVLGKLMLELDKYNCISIYDDDEEDE